jgi:hypothetical protein
VDQRIDGPVSRRTIDPNDLGDYAHGKGNVAAHKEFDYAEQSVAREES